MSSVGDFVIGGIAIGAAFAAGSFGLGFLAAPLFAYGTGRIIGGISKIRSGAEQRIEGAKLNIRTTQGPIPVVYGKSRVGLRVSDMRVMDSTDPATPLADPSAIFPTGGGEDGTDPAGDRDVLVKVGALALGSNDGSGIQAVDDIRVYTDGVEAVVSPAAFSSAPSNTGVISRYSDVLKYVLEDGDDSQTTQTLVEESLGWGSDMKGREVAYGAFFFFFNTDIWSSGVPQITAVITGNRVYDPRSSAYINFAASGPSSDNYALCILDLLTSKRYGGGVPYAARDGGSDDFIDEQSFIDSANYCDDLVSIPGSLTEKRFRISGVIDTARLVGSNLAEMLAGCRGDLVWQNGKYRLVIRQVTVAESYEITEDKIKGPIEWVRKGSSIPNMMEATFPDELSGDYTANSVNWPLTGDLTFLDEDNGVENRAEVALPYTTGYFQSLRTIMVMLREARNDVLVNLVCEQGAYVLQVGRVVKVTHEGPGWDQLEFTVRQMALTPDGLVRLSLQQYTAAAYSLDTLDAQPSAPTTNLPNAGEIGVPTGVSLLSTVATALATQDSLIVPRIRLDWTPPVDEFLSHFNVRFRKTADADFEAAPDPKKFDTRLFIWPVTDLVQYTVEIQSVNTLGAVSAFVSNTVVVSTLAVPLLLISFDQVSATIDDDGSDLIWCLFFSFNGVPTTILHELDLTFFKDGVLIDQDLGVAVNVAQPYMFTSVGTGGVGNEKFHVTFALKLKATNRVFGPTADAIPVQANTILNEDIIPDSDVSNGGYSNTPLWEQLDDEDSNFIFAEAAGTCPGGSAISCEVTLSNPSATPASSATNEARIRGKARIAGTPSHYAIGCLDFTLELRQGAALIASQQITGVGPSYTSISRLLTDVEYDSISDHNDLRIRIICDVGFDNEASSEVQADVNHCLLDYSPK